MDKKFNIEELKKYNGLNNKPAYLGYKGKVYDVSKIFINGDHKGIKAGVDLTNDFANGPHTEDIFSSFDVVGELVYKTSCVRGIFKVSPGYVDILLRLALGIIFFAHGSQKLLGWFGGYGWTGTMGFLTQKVGLPASIAALTILIEFFGGLAIILGLFTRPAALGLTFIMLGAIFKVHLINGFFMGSKSGDGIEYVFALLMLSIYFVVKGAGIFSVDKLIYNIKK